MLSLDVPSDQFVAVDDPLYESKNEASYHNLQPISFTGTHYPFSVSSVFDAFLQNDISGEDALFLDGGSTWQFKVPSQWSPTDVVDWMMQWAKEKEVDLKKVNMVDFNNLSGQDLIKMSRSDFFSIDEQYGISLYEYLQLYLDQSILAANDFPTIFRTENNIPAISEWATDSSTPWPDILEKRHRKNNNESSESDREDRESTSSSMSTVNEKSLNDRSSNKPVIVRGDQKCSRRGRPPKGESKNKCRQAPKGTGKLWEFIRDLLLNPATNPSLIRWERKEEGIFKFVQSDTVAKMWGERKQNYNMTYEKLSRAMRYYYKSQVLLPVFGRRLVYKFGPNATGWRPV